jgi:hypothetical protein
MAIMQVPVTKGKGFVELDTDSLPEGVYAEALLQGLKTLVNRGMSKVTEKDLGSKELVISEAMLVAAKNVEKIVAGDIKFSGKAKATAGKVDKAVTTEAMRIARDRIRDAIKADGKKKLYAIKASEISAAAKELLAVDPSILEQAEANLRARAETPAAVDMSALIAGMKEDHTKIAAKEAEKAAKKAEKSDKAPLSAKQAGMVKGRKPQAKLQHATH